MPFARIGAMPQPSAASMHNKNDGKSSSKGRSKGITMEDLKKQTAIRLAQEQKQGSDHVSSSVVPLQAAVPPQPSQSSYHPSRMDGGRDHTVYLANQYQRSPHNHHQQQMQISTSSPMMPMLYSTQPPQISYMMQQQHQQKLSGGFMDSGRHHHPSPTPLGQYAGTHPSIGYSQDSQMYLRTMTTSSAGAPQVESPATLPSNSHKGSDPNRLSASTTKSKLPHGLTVHELKEMTKARLQAEAAEKTDAERGLSPLHLEGSGSGELHEVVMSRDTTGRHDPVFVQQYPGAAQGEMGVILVPNMVHIQDGHRPPVTSFGGRQFPSSPLPPGMHGIGHQQYMVAPDQSMESIVYRTPARSETWDSASVASYNSTALSENLGSESFADSDAFVSGNRTRSFTYPAVQPVDLHPPGLSAAPSNSLSNLPSGYGSQPTLPAFDAAVGGNRRRAVTLSPNTGSFRDDRAHYFGAQAGRDQLQIPQLSTRHGGPMMQAQQRNYSPVLEQLGLSGGFGESGNGTMGYRSSNTRVPLPSIPQGGTPGSGGLASLSSINGPSDLFMQEPAGTEKRVSAPPGFLGPEINFQARSNLDTAFSLVGDENDNSDAGKKDQWGVVNRPQLGSVDMLGNDLGTILNLSGSNRPDRGRASTYTFGSHQPSSFDKNQFLSDGFIGKDLDSFPY